MLNQAKITTVSGTTRKTILVDELNSTAFSCKVAAGTDYKAGTPLAGDLTDRDVPFTAATTGENSNAVGILLHDVNARDGIKNAQIVVFGFIDVSKLEATVQSSITADVKKALNMIKFVK